MGLHNFQKIKLNYGRHTTKRTITGKHTLWLSLNKETMYKITLLSKIKSLEKNTKTLYVLSENPEKAKEEANTFIDHNEWIILSTVHIGDSILTN